MILSNLEGMDFITFDLETTGIQWETHEIVEIGALKCKEGQLESRFCTLVCPPKDIDKQASKITGITNEMVKDKPKVETVLPKLLRFCGHYPLVAHNASFDFRFLKKALDRFQLPYPRGVFVDTLTLSQKLLPGLPNYKLSTLVQYLQVPQRQDFHRAEADAYYCAYLFLHLLGKLGLNDPKKNLKEKMQALFDVSNRSILKFPVLDGSDGGNGGGRSVQGQLDLL